MSAPKANGLTSLEIWLIGCILTVSLALFEYGIVLLTCHRNALNNRRRSRERGTSQRTILYHKAIQKDDKTTIEYNDSSNEEQEHCFEHKTCDFISLFVFPISFSVFVCVYWNIFKSGL